MMAWRGSHVGPCRFFSNLHPQENSRPLTANAILLPALSRQVEWTCLLVGNRFVWRRHSHHALSWFNPSVFVPLSLKDFWLSHRFLLHKLQCRDIESYPSWHSSFLRPFVWFNGPNSTIQGPVLGSTQLTMLWWNPGAVPATNINQPQASVRTKMSHLYFWSCMNLIFTFVAAKIPQPCCHVALCPWLLEVETPCCALKHRDRSRHDQES